VNVRSTPAALAALLTMTANAALADPCGMVPPIYTGPGTPITRVGEQITYVGHYKDIETIVLRPGFKGKVDEFGMLIPFPTPPAIRKAPDHIFPHVAAAIDPPEVVIDLRVQLLARNRRALGRVAQLSATGDKLAFKDQVRVLKQEAVGMYEVAVLEAGSAAALKRWMDQHGYKYPQGMDKPCEEYVQAGWCFVAVKTKVGQKKGVDPAPGQRNVNSKLPAGSTFDGHVQAMGFRFRTKELVVPMRLSAFNDGKLRNIVYLLTDKPQRIKSIPEEYVVRQISGGDLYRNVTGPLPLRIIGGTEKDIPEYQRRTLPQRRNPEPHNGAAKDLFASDLMAISRDELSLPHEEREKELLRIGERFGLRGGEIDTLNLAALKEEREKTVKQSLANLKNMTLTVVDGDFPREVLAAKNLTFAEYHMPARRNTPAAYDAKTKSPAGKKPGLLKLGALPMPQAEQVSVSSADDRQSPRGMFVAGLLAAAGLGAIAVWRRRGAAVAAILVLAAAATWTSGALAEDDAPKAAPAKADAPKADAEKPTIRQLINKLNDAKTAKEAVVALVARGQEAVPQLSGEAIEGNNITRRGWAIVALSEIGGEKVDALLTKVHQDGKQPMLVRTWAAAGRVYMTKDAKGLMEKAQLVSEFPALGRPVGMRIVESLNAGGEASPEQIVSVSIRIPKLQKALAPAIMALGKAKLINVMTSAKDQNVRRQAAGYLGALANQGDADVGKAVAEAYAFNADAKDVPWAGGPLWVPGIQWQKDDARALVGSLIRWHLWADRNGKKDEQNQIHNNIRSLTLARVAGYQSPGWQAASTERWLQVWANTVGKDEVRKILKEQGVEDNPKYASVIAKAEG